MIDFEKEKKEFRHFLYDNRDRMIELSKGEGDGFVEFRKGMEYKKNGDDKEALIYFYAAILKRYDNPGLYEETSRLLRRHELMEEELNVLEKGLEVVRKGTFYYQKMNAKIDEINNRLKEEAGEE